MPLFGTHPVGMVVSTADAVRALQENNPHLAAQIQALLQNYTAPGAGEGPGSDDVLIFGTREWWLYAGATFACVATGVAAHLDAYNGGVCMKLAAELYAGFMGLAEILRVCKQK